MKYLIKNVHIVNEGTITHGSVFIENEFIKEIIPISTEFTIPLNTQVIDGEGKYLLPGIIDCHVHFREPGLTHKADISSESKAAIAGGVTSYMEMPNTIPNATSNTILEEKYQIGAEKSLANYSFYLGANNSNIKEIEKIDNKKVCGIKVFLGASTGNMLVNEENALNELFSIKDIIIAAHCEDEEIINTNIQYYKNLYKDNASANIHPLIRSAEACYKATSEAINRANKYNTRLHLTHLTTEKEMSLLDNRTPLKQKKITSEACVHHLWFNDTYYSTLGNLIKCNPAIKTDADRKALFEALATKYIDIVATDHAPHTFEEKQQNYFQSPSGIPMVQHSLNMMLELSQKNKFPIESIVEKMCHNPAIIFSIQKRGFIRIGFYADIILVDSKSNYTANKNNIFYKCAWSPLEGVTFSSVVTHTFVNGNLIFENGNFSTENKGMRLIFER